MRRMFHFVLLAALDAAAFCPHPAPKACGVFFESDQVFVGKLLAQRYVGQDSGEIEYVFRRQRTLRGKVPATLRLRTGNDSGRWAGDTGKMYVLFARDGLIGGSCSDLDEPSRVRQTVEAIERLASATSASIEGEMALGGGGRDFHPAAGMEITFAGTGGTFRATTDADGAFNLSVPAGEYGLVTPGWQSSDYNRRDIRRFRVQRGECVQLQLVPGTP